MKNRALFQKIMLEVQVITCRNKTKVILVQHICFCYKLLDNLFLRAFPFLENFQLPYWRSSIPLKPLVLYGYDFVFFRIESGRLNVKIKIVVFHEKRLEEKVLIMHHPEHTMYITYSPKLLEHYQGSMHPESPERLI